MKERNFIQVGKDTVVDPTEIAYISGNGYGNSQCIMILKSGEDIELEIGYKELMKKLNIEYK